MYIVSKLRIVLGLEESYKSLDPLTKAKLREVIRKEIEHIVNDQIVLQSKQINTRKEICNDQVVYLLVNECLSTHKRN